MRQVRGTLFADYARMIRAQKHVDWSKHLTPGDLELLRARAEPDAWYPMESFERMGNAILAEVAGGDLESVRIWGRLQAEALAQTYPGLLAPGDPVDTLTRFRNLRRTFFDFEALDVLFMHEGEAEIGITYYMGMPAEEAAALQTLGFFEGLLELAGAKDIRAGLARRSWAGDPQTVAALSWS